MRQGVRYNHAIIFRFPLVKTDEKRGGVNGSLKSSRALARPGQPRAAVPTWALLLDTQKSPALPSLLRNGGLEVEKAMCGDSVHRFFVLVLFVVRRWQSVIWPAPFGVGWPPAHSACVSGCRQWWPG